MNDGELVAAGTEATGEEAATAELAITLVSFALVSLKSACQDHALCSLQAYSHTYRLSDGMLATSQPRSMSEVTQAEIVCMTVRRSRQHP